MKEEDATSAVGQILESTLTGWEEVLREVSGAQINISVYRWVDGEDMIAAHEKKWFTKSIASK
jgi:hypothetical protein